MNVFPIQAPPEESVQAKCSNCGAAVVADQRYCLTCGLPCSPVRLAFLDVLQAESELRSPAVTIAPPVAGYLPPLPRDDGAIGWLRRYSGLFGLLAVLLMTGLMGLLVGHWLAPTKAAGPQIVKIEGGALPAAAPAATTAASSPSGKTATTSSAATEAEEVKEVKEAESPKAKPKAPIKTSSSSLEKISKSKGKKYQQEINKLVKGDQPIETGG